MFLQSTDWLPSLDYTHSLVFGIQTIISYNDNFILDTHNLVIGIFPFMLLERAPRKNDPLTPKQEELF